MKNRGLIWIIIPVSPKERISPVSRRTGRGKENQHKCPYEVFEFNQHNQLSPDYCRIILSVFIIVNAIFNLRMVGLKFESENNRGKHVEKTECRTLLSGLFPVFSHPSIKKY